MEPMKLYSSHEELLRHQEDHEKQPYGYTQVYPGKFLENYQEKGGDIYKNPLGQEDGDIKKDKQERKKGGENNPGQSIYSIIADVLLSEFTFIRDESSKVYFYYEGIYVLADKITLAEFIKRNLPKNNVNRIRDPSFYSRMLLDLSSDYRIKVINRKKLDSRTKYLTAFQNGVYDCRRRMFLKFSPQYILFSKLEIEYKINAETPAFDSFLNSVSGGDKDIINLIWEMIAYILLPNNDGKCFFVMGTASNSGKSLLAKIIEAMFPDSAVNRAPVTSISGRFALASMSGKRINIASECVDGRIAPEVVNNIKILTGEESTNIEKKGEDAVREYIACKLLIATNSATAFAVKDSAFWNRMRIIPFLYSIPQEEQNADLFEELKAELDDIASIAVSVFACPLIESKYQFTVPDISKKLMSQWRNSNLDNLMKFLECKCEITHDMVDFIPVSELYDEYCEWLHKFNCYAEPLAIRDFSRKIRENFTQCAEPREKEKIGDKYVRVLHGLSWLEDYEKVH